MFIGRERKKETCIRFPPLDVKCSSAGRLLGGVKTKKGLRGSVCLWESLFPFFGTFLDTIKMKKME